jgi:hypothetical protein
MNAIVPHTPAAPPSFGSALIPKDMDQAMRLATAMANAKMVPQHLQGDVGSCLLIVDQAMRWQISPFAVAQCTSSIKGKLMYEGKLIAGVAVSCGAVIGDFDYEYRGDPKKPETLSVIARATRASDQKVKEFDLAWKDAKTANEWWTKQPEQQLTYAVVRGWVRRWTPSVLLGVYAPEEFDRGVAPDMFDGTTIDVKAETATETTPKKPTISEWMDGLQPELDAAGDTKAVDAIVFRGDVQKALDTLRNGALARLKSMLDAAVARTEPQKDVDPPSPEAATLIAALHKLPTDASVVAWRIHPDTKAAMIRLPDVERERVQEAVVGWQKKLNGGA